MNRSQQYAWLVLYAIVCLNAFAAANPVAADTGDVIASLIITFLSLVTVCAFLGWCKRRQDGTA